MTAFRKWFVALAVLVVVVGAAYGQAFQCTANAGVPNRVRGEGLAELVGDVLLNCQGARPTVGWESTIYANVQIFLSTNITSRITASTTTEALLAKDDPATPTIGTNVWQGVKAGDNSLLWTNIPIIPAAPVPVGSTYSTIIRITNVRANASQAFSAGQTFIPQQITMFVTVTASTAIPINNPTQVVAAVLKGLDFAVRNCADDGGIGTDYAQCSSVNSDLYGDPTYTGQTMHGYLKFSEGFDAAWKVRGALVDRQWGVYPLAQPEESGYMRTAWGDAIGRADMGTRLIARFANIPAGLKIFVTVREHPAFTSASIDAVLVSVSDPTGTGGSAGFPLTGTGSASCGSSYGGNQSILEVPMFGGAGAATWEITASSGTAVEVAYFGVAIAYSANPASNIPALSDSTYGTVSGNFAPISTVTTMSSVAPIPRFADLPISKTIVNVIPCITNLLFPFVTARAGFDTGIAISNTTLDNSSGMPGGTSGYPYRSRATNGACTLYYFGDKEDGTSLAKPVQTSGVINAGKQLVYTLFSGGGGIDATPGFQGYIIATCKFHLAHGFAFISDLGAQKLAMGYLGLVIPRNNNNRREPADNISRDSGYNQ